MKNNQTIYLKADNNRIINQKYIRWVKKINDCLEVCTKSIGCQAGSDTHRICEYNNYNSYNKLNKKFE